MKPGEFKIKTLKFKGNEAFSVEVMESLVPPSQKPNATLLSTPFSPKVSLFWFGKFFYSEEEFKQDLVYYNKKLTDAGPNLSPKKLKKYNKRISQAEKNLSTQTNGFMREIGEAPAVTDEAKVQKNVNNIQEYYRANGFRDATATYAIDYFAYNQAAITYIVTEKKPYLISKVEIDCADSTIKALIDKSSANSLIKVGDRYRQTAFNDDYEFDELDRIDTLMKNNGYFDFERQPNFIKVSAILDSSMVDTSAYMSVKVKISISQPTGISSYQKRTIRNVRFESTNPFENLALPRIDSTYQNHIAYVFNNTKFPPKLLDRKIFVRPGEVYSFTNLEETQRRISQLNQFGFLEIAQTKVNNDQVDISFKTPALSKYERTFEINGNSVQKVLGGGILGTLSIRNIMGKLENFENTFRLSSEGQPTSYDSRIRRSLELGFNTSLNFPTLLLPLSEAKLRKFENQRTQLRLGVNYSKLPDYQRTNFNLSLPYTFKTSVFETFEFSAFDVNYLYTKNTPQFQLKLDQLEKQGNTLKLLFGKQFVSSTQAAYTFSNNVEGKNKRSYFLRFSAEAGGTTLGLFENQEFKFLKKIGGDSLNFFRFVKINLDYRKYIPLAARQTLAYRMNLGVANPYGKNQLLPYEKSFFVGGTNSLRGWAPRSLGPGSAAPDPTEGTRRSVFAQPGDILMEGSLEHRHYLGRFYVNILGAAFVDVGNIWKWHPIEYKLNKANFDVSRFYKEFAISAGYGLRFDFDYFVFRYDIGLKFRDPSQTNKWVVQELFKGKPERAYNYNIINWSNIGIGFPF